MIIVADDDEVVERGDDLTPLIYLCLGLYILSKYKFDVAPAIEHGGAVVYEVLHNDEGHVKDLPGHQLTRAQLLQVARAAGFPDPKLAAAVALAESGGVPGAILRTSRENSIGLWQINVRAHPGYTEEELKDPQRNAAAAYIISKGGKDWSPWSAFKSGAYKKFQTGILAP